MNRLIEWWARNTVAANLLMVGIILSGLLGYSQMEREIFPTVRFPGLQVQVAWPGAGPRDVEEQLVAKIEEAVSDLDNIDFMRSFSSEGFAQVQIRLNQKADFSQFMSDVKVRVDSIASFPRGIEPPKVTQFINNEEYIRIAIHGNLSERDLKRLSETLRREVANLEGISLVQLFGTRREQVSIEISEDALRRYGLTFDDVANAVRSSSINRSAGSIQTSAGNLKLTARNIANTKAEFSDIIVRQTPDGATIRIGDIADVIDGFEDGRILATLNGEPAVLIQVLTTETMNITLASESVKKWIEERQKTLPSGATLTLWTDAAEDFNGRMATISKSAMQGLALVMIILLLTLRPVVALWVAGGIATAYAGAFIFLPATGVSLNMLSTFAFLLVLGIVVDDAIVVGESIHTESQKTGGGITAAIFGTQLVAKPVIFAVLTTIIAFLPWLFLSGPITEFTRHITMVVVLALTFSLVESLLILPAHLSKLKPREKLGAFGRFQKRIANSITNFAQLRYRKIGNWAVRRRYLCFSIFAGILIFGFGLLGTGWVNFGFDPDFEGDEIVVSVTLPEGSSYERALEILAQLQTAERQLEEQVNQSTEGEGKLIENWYTRSRRDSVLAIVKLAPPEVRAMSTKAAAIELQRLMGPIPDAEEVTVSYGNSNRDPGVDFSLQHTDLDILRDAADDLKTQLATYTNLYDIRDDLQAASEEVQISLLPGAEKLGLSISEVSRQVRQAYFGEEPQRLARNGQDVRVKVLYPRSDRYSIESLKYFRIRTPDGSEIPLLSVASLEYAPGINRIVRRNGKRAVRVSANLIEDVRDDIMKDLDENYFKDFDVRYPGIQRGSIGQAEGQRRFFAELRSLYFVALFAMYALLAVAFKSYFQPILIMIAMPFAFVGAIFGHFALGVVLDLFSFFGIAAAIGVVVNDNLVLMDYCNRLRDRGMAPLEAVVEAGVARFRPILLTSLTTIAGLTPMLLEKSLQAAALKPVVIALATGVFIAFFVTLLLVPSLYAIGEDILSLSQRTKARFKRLFGSKPKELPSQAE
ncbi:MAG: RND transporter [Kordiimonadales bacterium]|nr:MAG: RND transporter [Kordiimonadales bacterium]